MPDAPPPSPFESMVRAVRAERIALRAHPEDFPSIVGNRMAADSTSWETIESVLRIDVDTRPRLRWLGVVEETQPAAFIRGLNISACAARWDTLIGGTVDGAMHAWDPSLATRRTIGSGERAHSAGVSRIEFVAGNELAVSGDVNGNCYLLSPSDYRRTASYEGHRSAITSIKFHAGRQVLAAGAADGSVRVWERGATSPRSVLVAHSAPITAIAFCPDAQHLVSASTDGTLRSWETFSGRCLGTMRGHIDDVIGCAFLPASATESGDPRILSASKDGLVKLWTRDGAAVATLGGHDGSITDLRLRPSRAGSPVLAVTAGEDATVRIWNLSTEREERVLRGHAAPVLQAAPCGGDFEIVLSIDADGGCRLWKLDTGQLLREFGIDSGRRAQLSVSSDGRIAACVTEDGTLAGIDLGIGAEEGQAPRVAIDPTGGRVLIATGSRLLFTEWEADAFSVRSTVAESQPVIDADWAGAYYLTLHANDAFMSWGIQGGTATTSTLPRRTTAVALDKDGSILVAGGADGSATAFRPDLQLRDPISAPLSTLTGNGSPVNAAAVAMNGLTVLGGADGSLRLWNALTGERLLDIVAHPLPILDCDISHDGSLLLSAAADGALRVWDAAGRMLRHIAAHGAAITACWMGARTDRALTCSRDETVKLWDLENGHCLETYYGEAPFVSMGVAADRPIAAVADSRGCVTILQILDGFGNERRAAQK